MTKLCELIGGSHLYGLNSPESDIDIRYVFLNDTIGKVIGLGKHECQVNQKDEDSVGYELRKFLQLCQKTNTMVVEILFCNDFISIDPDFKRLVIDRKGSFLDTKQMYRSIKGYLQGEYKLITGERSGKLGGRRKQALDRYGYSYKNAVNALRLTVCGRHFFDYGVFPVNISKIEYLHHEYSLMWDIKHRPENYSCDGVMRIIRECEENMDSAFDNRNKNNDYIFDEEYANRCILELYWSTMEKLKK